MSNGDASSFTDTTTHVKLEPPRSLHGVEDAVVIWDTIARRFPNAAPLLCEMETVIERAEDLLRQLRTPCVQENDTSSSFHTPDFRESNATISMMSDIESFAEETNMSEHAEIIEDVETHDIRERSTDAESQCLSEQSMQREEEFPCQTYHLTSPSRLDEVVQHFETGTMNKCRNSQEKSDANARDSDDKGIDVSSEEGVMVTITEKNSLDGWTKVTDNALREWHYDTGNIDPINDNDSEIRPNVKNIDNCLLTENDGKGDENVNVNVTESNLQDSIAKCSDVHPRSPLVVLEEYAKRCKVSIKYEYKPKSKLYVITGDLCGFRAMSCNEIQDLAKNDLAAKILWMVAERQMDGLKLSSSICGLSDLSREETLEIIAFNKDGLKNASQKLYKFCLEKGESTPEYSVRSLKTNQGLIYTAQCVALGHVELGQGPRKDSAKIAAAENLYQKYETEQPTT